MTDGRFSGGTHGFCIGHVAPEAVDGGPIALVADGDRIVVDVVGHSIDLLVDEDELDRRRAGLKHPAPRYTTGRAGQVRPPGHRGRAGRGHRALSRAATGRSVPVAAGRRPSSATSLRRGDGAE